eukprot:CAMPEP_0116842794 /NCGR_PEP_ID=MMETSP0418-20121206/11717_1 /TAXON_ID=1158023 /ORGANISM="Astrosyne radiata, Strain 13vi08-1A" /LENGTH=51 /DNA_ID=CAMNT_0004473449 /DNA_START=293 /DNA_END=448 /DNA_ORIENTATION=+
MAMDLPTPWDDNEHETNRHNLQEWNLQKESDWLEPHLASDLLLGASPIAAP